MGAIIMFITLSVIAVCAVIYFNEQDKKTQDPNCNLSK